jgi:hypothetical protein
MVMANAHLPFWNGDEDREIRVFISHRFEADSVLYDEALAKLRSQGHAIQDMSLNVDTLIRGPNGGQRPLLEIKAQVAARIYTSDILMAPARPATTRSEWLSWEIELAAVGYGLPVLFIKEPELENNTRFIAEIRGLNLRHEVAERRPEDIVPKTIRLLGGRPSWKVRFDETESKRVFRGPPPEQLRQVMSVLPYLPRIGG